MALQVGLEPTTYGLTVRCTTIVLPKNKNDTDKPGQTSVSKFLTTVLFRSGATPSVA